MPTQQNQYDQSERADTPLTSTNTDNALIFWTKVIAVLTFLLLVVAIATWLWMIMH
jgi:hypothetical protein